MSWLGSPEKSKDWHRHESERTHLDDYTYYARQSREESHEYSPAFQYHLHRVTSNISAKAREKHSPFVAKIIEDSLHHEDSTPSGSCPSTDSGHASREGSREEVDMYSKAYGPSSKFVLVSSPSTSAAACAHSRPLKRLLSPPPTYSAAASIHEGSDSDGEEDTKVEGPPPLDNDDQAHVFFYHSAASQDTEVVEQYVAMLESAPYEMKCITNEKDFKGDLTTMQNLVLSVSMSQRVVIYLSDDFLTTNYEELEAILSYLLTSEERKQKVLVLLDAEVKVPKELVDCKHFELIDEEWNEKLTRILMGGPAPKEMYKSEPSAPPLEKIDEELLQDETDHRHLEGPREPPMYQNGQVIRHITAHKYREFEERDPEAGCCYGMGEYFYPCPRDLLCVGPQQPLSVPPCFSRRGMQIPLEDFEEILRSLSESAKIKLFHKSAECTMPCLYLSGILIIGVLAIILWFLSVGAIQYHQPKETHGSAIFWSFMIGIIFVPSAFALIMLWIMIKVANKKYQRFRRVVDEFNKRLRELNLVLHCRKSFWFCSGRLKLYFIYYNFEECQQMLYRQVCSGMSMNGHTNNIEENANLLHSEDIDHYENGHTATVKIDRIMKRVNSLVKRYEWEFFEKLITNKLPPVEQFEHRKRGICFCQYAQLRNREDMATGSHTSGPTTVTSTGRHILSNIHMKATFGRWTRAVLGKSSQFSPSPEGRNGSTARMNGYANRNGSAHFASSEPGEVVFI